MSASLEALQKNIQLKLFALQSMPDLPAFMGVIPRVEHCRHGHWENIIFATLTDVFENKSDPALLQNQPNFPLPLSVPTALNRFLR